MNPWIVGLIGLVVGLALGLVLASMGKKMIAQEESSFNTFTFTQRGGDKAVIMVNEGEQLDLRWVIQDLNRNGMERVRSVELIANVLAGHPGFTPAYKMQLTTMHGPSTVVGPATGTARVL
jgi:hypothetical protein